MIVINLISIFKSVMDVHYGLFLTCTAENAFYYQHIEKR